MWHKAPPPRLATLLQLVERLQSIQERDGARRSEGRRRCSRESENNLQGMTCFDVVLKLQLSRHVNKAGNYRSSALSLLHLCAHYRSRTN